MKEIYRKYLFNRHVFVAGEAKEENRFAVLYALAGLFGIRITKGRNLADKEMIKLASLCLGKNVPDPFYRGFPASVRELSPDALLYDQLLHYVTTYGLGDFSEAGHSVFERQFERTAFREKTEIRDFVILTEAEAEALLSETAEGLLAGTRPLNEEQYAVLENFLREYAFTVTRIASKNTCVRLLADTGRLDLVRFLSLPDVIKLADEIQFRKYGSEDLKDLHFQSADRRLITRVLDLLLENENADIRTCYEKKKLWNGLLHHIHYKPKNKTAEAFLAAMRGRENRSVYASVERLAAEGKPVEAARYLRQEKGSGALLRQLDFLVSRCQTMEEVKSIADLAGTGNTLILLQLLIRYSRPETGARTFVFPRHNKTKIHFEVLPEGAKRQTLLSAETLDFLRQEIEEKLKAALKNRLGKVYIDPDMKRYALPLNESAAQGGFGVLAKGTRLPLPAGKKVRAFTYWEKVEDIDISGFGIAREGDEQVEFSWRTMAGEQSAAVTYSGDQTSGYDGGSEYFDFDLDEFRQQYPTIRYMVFCDNVFTGTPFSACICRAGYMMRDVQDSGRVFEPKTVQSAFTINCNSTFAYLFGIDLDTREFVWLNLARSGAQTVAGATSMTFLLRYFHVTETVNLHSFFAMMATELTENPAEAEVAVTDKTLDLPETVQVIREYDFDKIIALMN